MTFIAIGALRDNFSVANRIDLFYELSDLSPSLPLCRNES